MCWGLYLALSLVSGHAAAARLVTRKSYLLEPPPAPTPAPASAHGFGFTRHSTELHEATLLCIFRVMPTFFNLPNSGSAEWAATYAIIHICHTRAEQTRPGLTRLGLPGCSALLSCVIYANVKYFEMPLPCERKQTEVHYKVLSLRQSRRMLFGQPANRNVP